jgi:hypothetical protein
MMSSISALLFWLLALVGAPVNDCPVGIGMSDESCADVAPPPPEEDGEEGDRWRVRGSSSVLTISNGF